MGVLDWFQSMSPQAQAALLGGGLNVLGGLSSGAGLEGQQEDSQAHQMQLARLNALTGLYGADTPRYIAAQNAIGSPLAIQRERAGMAMLGDMLGNAGASSTQQVFAPPHIAPFQGRVGGGASSSGTPSRASSFLTPDAMVNAEVPFWQNLSALNPDINPNLQNVGYGAGSPATNYAAGMIDQSRLGNMAKQQSERDAIMGALGGGGGMATGRQAPPDGYEYDKKTGQLKKKGGGFWSKLGKVALGIGGGIATAMTGGAAAPLLGAAFGAAGGALGGGGWKGALTGGALGGLTGGLGGGANQGFGQAVRSTLTSPRALTNAAGMGIGGPAGAAMQIGSTMMPGSFGATPRSEVTGVEDRIGRAFAQQGQPRNSTADFIQMILGGQGGGNPGSVEGRINNAFNRQGSSFVDPNAGQGNQMQQMLLQMILGGMGGRNPGGLSPAMIQLLGMGNPGGVMY